MRILDLRLYGVYFDEIVKGTKKKEFREITDYSIGYYYFSNDASAVAYAKYQEFVMEIKGPTPSAAKKYAEQNGFSFVSTGDVSSDEGTFGDGLRWTVRLPAGLLTFSGNGVCPDYESPDETPWALYNEYIRTVSFTGLKSVGAGLFDGMKDVSSVSLPGSVRTIGKNSFSGTGLSSISLPSGLNEIGDGAFENCRGITSLSIPGSLRQIGVNAFKSHIGDGVANTVVVFVKHRNSRGHKTAVIVLHQNGGDVPSQKHIVKIR